MYGQNSELGLCFQNSFGTLNTGSMHWIPFLEETLPWNKDQLIDGSMMGVFDEGEHYEGRNSIEGDISCNLQAVPLGVFLKAVCGPPTTTTLVTSAVWQHVFVPQQSDFDIFSANRPVTASKYYDTGSADLMYDLVGSMLELAYAEGEFVKMKLGLTGGNHSMIAPISPTFPTKGRMVWDASSVSFAGSALPYMLDCTITQNEALEVKHAMDSSRGKWPRFVKRSGRRVVEFAGTIRFSDHNLYNNFKVQSEGSLILHARGATQISSGYFPALTVSAPTFRLTAFPVAAGGDGEIDVGFSGKAVYNTGSGHAIQYTLVNTVPSYA